MINGNFLARVCDVEINGIWDYLNVSSETDFEIENNNALIKYSFDCEVRDWGIKTIYCNINSVDFVIDWSVYADTLVDFNDKVMLLSKGGSEYKLGIISGKINISSKDENWSIMDELKFADDGRFTINNVCVCLITKTIILSYWLKLKKSLSCHINLLQKYFVGTLENITIKDCNQFPILIKK